MTPRNRNPAEIQSIKSWRAPASGCKAHRSPDVEICCGGADAHSEGSSISRSFARMFLVEQRGGRSLRPGNRPGARLKRWPAWSPSPPQVQRWPSCGKRRGRNRWHSRCGPTMAPINCAEDDGTPSAALMSAAYLTLDALCVGTPSSRFSRGDDCAVAEKGVRRRASGLTPVTREVDRLSRKRDAAVLPAKASSFQASAASRLPCSITRATTLHSALGYANHSTRRSGGPPRVCAAAVSRSSRGPAGS
jgi:hypothetical protein